MPAVLEVRNLAKRYGSRPALDGVMFHVEHCEIFGLLGPNGAGKTTLLSIVSGLLDADGGEVRILGQPFDSRARHLRKLIGIVPQELAVYADLTARENLRFFGELYGLTGQHLRERIDRVLADVGLVEKADDRCATFSGGMKRRLNLGAALVHEPKLLLLDEPTVGVDPQSRNHIFEGVRRLNAEGMTIVYTSHYMEEVQTLCPRVGIINQGVLQACDTVPNLLRELDGLIRFRVGAMTATLRSRLADLPESRFREEPKEVWCELSCRDVKESLLRLVALLNEMNVELTTLEIEEPNLERVFLHITGRDLRDE